MKSWWQRTWAWFRFNGWAVALFFLGIIVFLARVVLSGANFLRLKSWFEAMRAQRDAVKADAGLVHSDVLTAQRAKLLNEIVEVEKTRAQLESREAQIKAVTEKEEARIRDLSAEEVAQEFNQLRMTRQTPRLGVKKP